MTERPVSSKGNRLSSGFPAFPSLAPPRVEMPTIADEAGRVLVVDDSPTIVKVVTAILERHGYEVVGARDGVDALERLREGPPFDLVLLDFAMPRMNGYQFCRELRKDDKLEEMPVVLMSARTATIGDRFVEQTGAADALSKPFDARALVAVVGGVLSKRLRGDTGRQAPAPEEMMDESLLDSVDSLGPPPSRHVKAVSRFASELATAVAPQLRNLRGELGQPQLIEDAIVAALSEDATVTSLARSLDEVGADEGTNVILRGAIEHLPLAEVLQLLQMRRQTGVLKATYGRKTVVMALRDGHVDMAQGRCGDEFRLGRYLVRMGRLSREQVEEQVDTCAGKTVIGQWLVEQGLVTPEELRQALTLQSAELSYEAIRWNKGRFVLTNEPFWPEAEQAKLELGLAELVLEGFRRVDEWRLMADTIDFEAVPIVDPVALEPFADKIGADERRVIDAIDGVRTVREVMEHTAMASFDVIAILYRCFETRIVRKK